MDTTGFCRELERRIGPGRVEHNVPLGPMTTFKIGGPADLFVRARTPDELADAILAARELGIPHFLLGRGANILVGDGGFRGLVIHSQVGGIDFLDDVRVRAGAGVDSFPDLIQATVRRGLGGLHHFVGIPSTIGGAMWQNLHFLAPERDRTVFLEEVVESAEILTEEGERRCVDLDYFQFGYDYSILHERDDIVLTTTFRLEPTPAEGAAAGRFAKTCAGGAIGIPTCGCTRARARFFRRSRASAPAVSSMNAGSRDIATATPRSSTGTPTSS